MMKSNKYYIVLLLIAMFAAPGIMAYIFYQHPTWLGSAKVNKGTLLTPPIALNVLKKNSKWHLIFWSPKTCEKACLNQLETIAKIRLALGRRLYQVDQWLITGTDQTDLSPQAKGMLRTLDFQVAQFSKSETDAKKAFLSEPKVFLADAENYLILSYTMGVNPDDVYKDLKLLLHSTDKQG